ncbi:MAG: GntR family transcriptional regulator [Pseudomonadota bacterium]
MSDLDRTSWQGIRDQIRERILDSTYRPGDKLPRDHDIAAELECARSTVQRAMRSLADDGIVERKRKGGTIVKPDPVTRAVLNIPIARIEIENRGFDYRHHLISQDIGAAPPAIAAQFGLSQASPVAHVVALHMAAGRPFVLEDRWISLDTVPEFRSVDLAETSANEWLVRHRPYSRCDVQIHATAIDADDAQLMGVAPGAAMLVLERTTWIGEKPITHVKATHAEGYRLMTSS